MAPDQMGMSAPAISPDQLAIFDQMRQEVSPKEFSDEILAGASQVDPQAVAEFRQELEAQELPPEVLDAINDMVDAILADPSRYDEIRQEYLAQDMPEEMLPEQFDPQFFAALNMAVDQMIAAPAGPQAFAKGGIAELKPIAKALASYGRNGDTMLAHITPAEARMLKRRGGSGTINPDTGLPEFFLKKLFRSVGKALKSVGNAVKKFVRSSVGRVITTVALGFFLGPAAASMLGATSAAGVAAVSGFVGSAGSTLLAGGNLRDALKAGAIGGLTAGAGSAIMGGSAALQAGSYTGPTTVGGQWDRLKDMLTPGQAAAPAPVPTGAEAAAAPAPAGGETLAAAQAPLPGTAAAPAAPTAMGPGAAPTPLGAEFKPFETTASRAMNLGSDLVQGAKNVYNQYLSPSGIREQAIPGAQQAGQKAIQDLTARLPDATPAMKEAAYQSAFKAAMPGVIGTYGPLAATGLGIAGLAGGFEPRQPAPSELAQRLRGTPGTDLINANPNQYLVQNLPGVQYDSRGNIIGSTPWSPNATMEDVRVPAAGIGSLAPAPMYSPEGGSVGAGRGIFQPYNTSSMYTNIMRPTTMPYANPFAGYGGYGMGMPAFAEGGEVEDMEYMMHGGMPHGSSQMAGLASLAQGGYPRRTGQISGPGTETSDSIPAMLSDGEFVMTAKAVKGLGNGSRRAGAKKMYALMHQLERNASRG